MKNIFGLLMALVLIFTMSACSTSSAGSTTSSTNTGQQNAAVPSGETSSASTNTIANTTTSTGAASVAGTLAENSETHEDTADYVWDSSTVISITLNGDSISEDGDGVTVEGSTAFITSAGTYSLSGSLSDGRVIVNTENKEPVRLILNGIDLHSSTSAPIYVMSAEETVLILADNTENYISDTAAYVYEDLAADEPNAAIFTRSDLTIYGNGSLTVNGNYLDGISSKDGLIITSGTITVNAVDDGIRGKDYLVIKDGNITVNAQGDGLKSDNEEDATKGFISVEAGVINVTAAGDAINATTDVMVTGGEFTLSSGGGSNNWANENISAKGIKGVVSVNIDGGTFNISSADDSIHSNGSVVINNGVFVLASGDDGVHADATLEVNGGDIRITDSYEGLESAVITINAGSFRIVSSDDGINVAGGVDGSGMNPRTGQGGGIGQVFDAFAGSGNYHLYINGGFISVEAAGDGLDVNGAIEMTNGIVLVNGPTENMNGALDYDRGFTMTGGFLVAAGSSGMAMAPGANSSQNSVLIYLSQTQPAGTLVHIQNSAGEDILTFSPTKQYQSIAFSSPDLVDGNTYEIYLGGSSSGTVTDGLYQDGSYTPGTQYTSFTVSGATTMIGNGGLGGGGGGGARPGRP